MRPLTETMLHGFLNVDKPAGFTSHDVVAQLRRAARQKRIGHGGTLDPSATGVLPVALGEATRLVEYLVEGRKRYTAVIELGMTTTTDDAEGEVVGTAPVPSVAEADLEQMLRGFEGIVEQVPPMYSALQIDGKRLYQLARQGVSLELPPRRVEIERIDVLRWESPFLTIDVRCGKGTYIRALARDIGVALGCGGHLRSLCRTEVASLAIDAAVPLAELVASPESLAAHLQPPEAAVAYLVRVDLNGADADRVRNGLPLDLAGTASGIVRAHDPDGRLLALVRYDQAMWRPFKVFAWR